MKNIRYPNHSDFPRAEVAYATVPFDQGEWDGRTSLVLKDGNDQQVDAVIEQRASMASSLRWTSVMVLRGTTTDLH